MLTTRFQFRIVWIHLLVVLDPFHLRSKNLLQPFLSIHHLCTFQQSKLHLDLLQPTHLLTLYHDLN